MNKKEQKNRMDKRAKEQKNKRTKINKIHPLALSRLGLFRAEFPAFPHVFSILNPQFSVYSHSLLSSPALLLYIPTYIISRLSCLHLLPWTQTNSGLLPTQPSTTVFPLPLPPPYILSIYGQN